MKLSLFLTVLSLAFLASTSSADLISSISQALRRYNPHSNRLQRILKNHVTVSVTVEYTPYYDGDVESTYERSQEAYILNKRWLLATNDIFYDHSHGEYPLVNTTVATIGGRNISAEGVYNFYNYTDITLFKLSKRIPSYLFSFTPIATKLPAIGKPLYFIGAEDNKNTEFFQLTRVPNKKCEYLYGRNMYCVGLPGQQVTGNNRTNIEDRCIYSRGPMFSIVNGKPMIIGRLLDSFGSCYTKGETARFHSYIPERRVIHRVIYKGDLTEILMLRQSGLTE